MNTALYLIMTGLLAVIYYLVSNAHIEPAVRATQILGSAGLMLIAAGCLTRKK